MKVFVLILSIFLLTGCSHETLTFNEIMNSEIGKISTRHSGTGILYASSERKIIQQLNEMMQSTTYSRTDEPEPITGNSGLGIYNEQGEHVGNISFFYDNIVNINGNFYQMNHEIDKQKQHVFYKIFLSEKNRVLN